MRSEIRGYALIEIMVAVMILSLVMTGVFSGVSKSALSIAQARNLTRAIFIARSKLNEFKLVQMRGTDLKDEPVKEYQGFTFDRQTERYESAILGPIPAHICTITVNWEERGRPRTYSINYIYPDK